jgi:hypothetical protein
MTTTFTPGEVRERARRYTASALRPVPGLSGKALAGVGRRERLGLPSGT